MAKPQNASKTKSTPKRRRMRFSLEATEAGTVVLAGDFNGWDVRLHPMRKKDNGRWEREILLGPGRYEYKFLVDGRWQTAAGEDEELPVNCFGTRNHVIQVEER